MRQSWREEMLADLHYQIPETNGSATVLMTQILVDAKTEKETSVIEEQTQNLCHMYTVT